MECKLCQSPIFQNGAFAVAIILILIAMKFGVEGLLE